MCQGCAQAGAGASRPSLSVVRWSSRPRPRAMGITHTRNVAPIVQAGCLSGSRAEKGG